MHSVDENATDLLVAHLLDTSSPADANIFFFIKQNKKQIVKLLYFDSIDHSEIPIHKGT